MPNEPWCAYGATPELPDLLYFAAGADQVLDAIEEFVTGVRPLPSPDRFLGTVLFVDVVGSTQRGRDGRRSPALRAALARASFSSGRAWWSPGSG